MTKKIPLATASLAALLGLAACNNNNQPEVIDTNPDPMATQLANATPVELPPSVKESVSYRCKDNSVVYVDFLSDGSANVRTEKGALPTHVVAPAEGGPMVAEGGYSVSGAGKSVQIAVPGKPAQNCNR